MKNNTLQQTREIYKSASDELCNGQPQDIGREMLRIHRDILLAYRYLEQDGWYHDVNLENYKKLVKN